MRINIDKVKKIRLNKNLSQEQLSEISGLSLRTIQRIESGKSVSMESLKVLSIALGVDSSELIEKERYELKAPLDVIKNCFIEYSNFTGKASRYEYWWFL